MDGSTVEKTNVFQFMVIRTPASVEPKASQRNYIRDDAPSLAGRSDADLFSTNSSSKIGVIVYQKVFCDDPPPIYSRAYIPQPTTTNDIFAAVLGMLPSFAPGCPSSQPREIEALRDRPYLFSGGRYYLLPYRLEDLPTALASALPSIHALLRSPPLKSDGALDRSLLINNLRALFDGRELYDVVFALEKGGYSDYFADAKRQWFDTLYLLYIMRRRISVDLAPIIEGLRAIHVVEALATDEFVAKLEQQGKSKPHDEMLLHALEATYPSLRPWTFKGAPASMPLIGDLADLLTYMSATPIIHPIFARLRHFRKPFNLIRPLGLGDLKVVKQWLCGYKAGEFAHVENVLAGETKNRIHRRLEKTDQTFSFSSDTQQDIQRDVQTTDRFELKREAESVIKQDLAINTNASVTYSSMPVVATITAGMSFARSQTDQNKAAATFSREVMDKAVKRVQTRASEQRSTTKLFETEETNTHEFANTAGNGNVSGIYRWLDKEYRAQLYNYGKRLMFEFILPEPAAFFVEARLRAFESQLEVPKPPPPVLLQTKLPDVDWWDIKEHAFKDLALKYDLSAFTWPLKTKVVALKDTKTDHAYFGDLDMRTSKMWIPQSFTCELEAQGYDITGLRIDGDMDWSSNGGAGNLANLFAITVNGTRLYLGDFSGTNFFPFRSPNNTVLESPLRAPTFTPYRLTAAPINLTLGFQNTLHYAVEISAELSRSADELERWQREVWRAIARIEQAPFDKLNEQAAETYQAALATYHNRLADLRSMAINDLLQGQSTAFNRQLISTELKRLCLSTLTKEFDADLTDDTLTQLEAMGSRQVTYSSRQLSVTEKGTAPDSLTVEVDFEVRKKLIGYPAPDLPVSAAKGRYIQFLEQAFDWQQLAYVFYPYFWATPPKWIDLMSRLDQTDATLSAFLQAGSCKVLLAVAPSYDDAVLHYLATGEPWEGGLAPVIGDPLYVPLYEELRRQQDDLEGATPDGPSWKFTVPTSLVYLEGSSTPLPESVCEDTS